MHGQYGVKVRVLCVLLTDLSLAAIQVQPDLMADVSPLSAAEAAADSCSCTAQQAATGSQVPPGMELPCWVPAGTSAAAAAGEAAAAAQDTAGMEVCCC